MSPWVEMMWNIFELLSTSVLYVFWSTGKVRWDELFQNLKIYLCEEDTKHGSSSHKRRQIQPCAGVLQQSHGLFRANESVFRVKFSQNWICNYYNWTKACYHNLYSQCSCCLHPLKTRGKFGERVGARIWGNVSKGRISASVRDPRQGFKKEGRDTLVSEKWKHPPSVLGWEFIPSPRRHCFTQGTFLSHLSLLHAVDILKMLIIYVI